MNVETELTALVEAGDIEGTLSLLRGLPSDARASLKPFARAVAEKYASNFDKERSTWEGRPRTPDGDAPIQVRQRRAAICVVIAGGDRSEILGCADQTAIFLRAVRELRPPCTASLAETLVSKGALARICLCRALVAEGLCERPGGDDYVLAFFGRELQGGLDHDWHRSLRDALLDDPAHLVADVERLFEVEGTSDLSLASHDKYAGGISVPTEKKSPRQFGPTIVQLTAEGALDRARMLDLALATLAREWPAFRSGWFSRFHDALAPSAQEIAAREATYVALLASTIPATVAMAVDALTMLQASPESATMDRDALGEALGAVMTARAKGTALGGIRLLARAIEAEPRLARRGSHIAALALAHDGSDVQRAALDLLDAHGAHDDEALRDLCAERVDLVAASLRKRARAWAPPSDPARVAPTELAIPVHPAPAASHVDAPRGGAAGREPIEPIEDPAELVLRLSSVLETGDDVIEIERALDGVARLAGDPRFGAPVRTLRKRAAKAIEKEGWERPVLFEIGRLVLALTDGALPAAATWRNARGRVRFLDALDLLGNAIEETAAHALDPQRRGLPRLATPTERPAFVDPVVLARRALEYAERDVEPGVRDAEMALLRLPPPDARREAAHAIAASTKSRFGIALQYALGVTDAPPADLGLRLAASRARDLHGDDPHLAPDHVLGAGGGLATRHTWEMARHHAEKYSYPHIVFRRVPAPAPTPSPPSALVLALQRGQIASTFGRDNETYDDLGRGDLGEVRYLALIWPRFLDLFFVEGAALLTGNLEFGSRYAGHRAYVEPLLWPTTLLEEPALVLLAVALAAKPPDESGLAVEALARAADDGRLDPLALGSVMARMRSTGVILLARWAKTLTAAARISPAARTAVIRCLERALSGTEEIPGEAGDPPRDLAKLLELLFELRSEAEGGPLPATTQAYLRALPDAGKLKKLKRELLA